MAYVIGGDCVGELDGSCVDVCPVDCIYEGDERRYINPNECIECGACVSVCPVSAIKAPSDGPDPAWTADNANFFALPLPTRTEALGDPGGATGVGRIGVDTEFTTEYAARG